MSMVSKTHTKCFDTDCHYLEVPTLSGCELDVDNTAPVEVGVVADLLPESDFFEFEALPECLC